MKLVSVFVYLGKDIDGTTASYIRAVFQNSGNPAESVVVDTIPTMAIHNAWSDLEAILRCFYKEQIE